MVFKIKTEPPSMFIYKLGDSSICKKNIENKQQLW